MHSKMFYFLKTGQKYSKNAKNLQTIRFPQNTQFHTNLVLYIFYIIRWIILYTYVNHMFTQIKYLIDINHIISDLRKKNIYITFR